MFTDWHTCPILSVTDISIQLTDFLVENSLIIRNMNFTTSISMTVSNRNGASVDVHKTMSSYEGPNFKLSLWVSDYDGLTSQYNQSFWCAEYNLTLAQWEDLVITENMTLQLSADMCHHARYFCVMQEAVHPNVYIDLNTTNNYRCSKINIEVVCAPGKSMNQMFLVVQMLYCGLSI